MRVTVKRQVILESEITVEVEYVGDAVLVAQNSPTSAWGPGTQDVRLFPVTLHPEEDH